MGMLYAAIDIHKRVFQAAVLDPASGEIAEARFPATRDALREWALPLQGAVAAVAVEATCGWRWVWRELSALGFAVRLAEPAQTLALKGRKRTAKTDRLDERWLALLLAKEMLPASWIPPADIQRLRDLTRLRQALRHDRTRWAQRLHAILHQEGWSCSRGQLLSSKGRRWLDGLALDRHVRALVDAHVAMIAATTEQMAELERELRRLARSDRRLVALQRIYGVGPVVACHLLAEIGDARRFRRAEQVVRLSGLDPVVLESADSKRRGKLSKQGSPPPPLGARPGRPARRAPPPLKPRRRPLPRPPETHRQPTSGALDRAQDRQARLPHARGARGRRLSTRRHE
jgi:transposase